MKNKFYTLDNILRENADYNIIYGERSNGSRWVFNMDTKAFEAYVDPLDEKASGSATANPGA